MLGFFTGDIVGSPYRQNNKFDEDFKLFDTHTVEFYRKKERDWTRLEKEAKITGNVVPAVAVMRWLLYSDDRSVKDLANELIDMSLNYGGFEYGPDRNALAFLPLGLYARDEKELSDLQDSLRDALSVAARENEGLLSSRTFSLKDEDFTVACLLSEAVFKVAHGLPKNELLLWADGLFKDSLRVTESQVREGSVKEGDVQNTRELNYSILKNNVKDVSLERSFFAALYSFLYSDDFEKGLRKSVSFGGCSTTVAGIYGALGQIAYGAVPPQIAAQTEQFLDQEMHKTMSSFEKAYMVHQAYSGALKEQEDEGKEAFYEKANAEGKAYVQDREHRQVSSNIVEVIERKDLSPFYVVPEDWKELRAHLKDKGVDDAYVITPEEKDSLLEEMSSDIKDGTYIMNSPRPEVRQMYFSNGKLLSVSGTMDKAVKTDLDLRKRIRYCFNDFKARVENLRADIQKDLGFTQTRDIHFASAAYVEVGKDRVVVYRGQSASGRDNILGEVRIDDKTGLIRLNKQNEGLEHYEVGIFDDIKAQKFIPIEAFSLNNKDRAELRKNYPEEDDYQSHAEAVLRSRKNDMLEKEEYYNIQPLQDVFEAIETVCNDITTAQDARLDEERKSRNTGSPYDFEGRKTNLDLMNEDISNTEDPVIQRECWGSVGIKMK